MASYSKPRPTKAETQARNADRIAAAQAVIQAEVEKLVTGADWQGFLSVQAKLHNYSANNAMLLWAEHTYRFQLGQVASPEPGVFAGYKTWSRLGRDVTKGSKGYPVIAPVTRKMAVAVSPDGSTRRLDVTEEPRPTEIAGNVRRMSGFTVAFVFAECDTTGPPLPRPPAPTLLAGQSPEGLAEAVTAHIVSKGFTVSYVDPDELGGANGVTSFDTHTVKIRNDAAPAQATKTLLHECGHVLLHMDDAGQQLPRAHKEVEAESVAFVVASVHGMATGEYSWPYVATWAARSDPAESQQLIMLTQRRVANAAREIIEVSPAADVLGGGGIRSAEVEAPSPHTEPLPPMLPSDSVQLIPVGF